MGDDDAPELTDAGLGSVIELGFLDHYLLLDATRKRAVQRVVENPPTIAALSHEHAAAQTTQIAVAAPEPEPFRAAPRSFEAPEPEPTPEPERTVAPRAPRSPTRNRTAAERAAPPARSAQSARAQRSGTDRGDRLPLRRDRREEILDRLASGPASAQELADLFEISREGVLRWLRLLESDGRIHSTAKARTSRTNRWVLNEGAPPG